MTADRFIDTGKHLIQFADEVLVNCVRCGSPGTVVANWIPYKWVAQFDCKHCHLELRSADEDWVGPVRLWGRVPCGYCGHKWLSPYIDYPAPLENPPSSIPASCPQCGHQCLVNASMRRIVPGDQCIDPHFGLPLRLVADTRHGSVWAYNRRHLAELSGYVSATLRVRQGGGNGAMFSRLPKWMKLAKHRDEIAKALSRIGQIE